MRRHKLIYPLLILLGISFSCLSRAANDRHPQTLIGHLTAIDKKNKTVVIDGQRYPLRLGAKIFIAGQQVSRSSLYPDRKIRYTTHKNQRSGIIEIKEITVLLL